MADLVDMMEELVRLSKDHLVEYDKLIADIKKEIDESKRWQC